MKSLRRDHICPQCEHRKLWRVEHAGRVKGPAGRTASLSVTAEVSAWSGFHPAGAFAAFICAQCGFTEWYAAGLEELKHDPEAGVYFIDDEPKAGLR